MLETCVDPCKDVLRCPPDDVLSGRHSHLGDKAGAGVLEHMQPQVAKQPLRLTLHWWNWSVQIVDYLYRSVLFVQIFSVLFVQVQWQKIIQICTNNTDLYK